MWQDLVWNMEFARGSILLLLAILASVYAIPRAIQRLQDRRNKVLVKKLLREWGGDCIGAMMRVKPPGTPVVEIEGYGHTTPSGGFSSVLPPFSLWADIREGKRNPEGSSKILSEAYANTLFTEEERAMKESPPDVRYPMWKGDPEVPRAMIKRVQNPMYARIDILDFDLLPVNELEMAVSYLESFAQKGCTSRYALSSYSLHLAESMEKFGKYLWKLENWSRKEPEHHASNRKSSSV